MKWTPLLVTLCACGAGEPLAPPAAALPPMGHLPPPRASIHQIEPPAPTPAVMVAEPPLAELQLSSLDELGRAFADHQPARLAELYAHDATVVAFGLTEQKGREAIARDCAAWFAALPDARLTAARTWLKGNVAIFEWILSGTQKGDLLGLKATGQPVRVRGVSILRYSDKGKIRREQRYVDVSAIRAQLGRAKRATGVPEPAAPAAVVTTGKPSKGDLAGAVAKALRDAWDRRSMTDWIAQLGNDAVVSDTLLGADRATKAEHTKLFRAYAAALPEARTFVDDVWVVGDTAIAEIRIAGPQKSALGPIAVSKAPLVLHAVDIVRAHAGKAVEINRYASSFEVLSARGLVPWVDKPAK